MNIPVRWNMNDKICEAYERKNAGTSALHGHHHFLITLITRGEGIQTLNGEDVPFKAGDLFILSPADFHKNTITCPDGYDYLGAKFPFEVLDPRLCDMCELDRFPIRVSLCSDTEKRIRSAFELLVEESSKMRRTPDSEILLSALIEQIFILSIRALPKKDSRKSSAFVNRALSFLYSNFSKPLTVGDAAAYVGYTPNYFNSMFHKEFGAPFASYLRNMRLGYAKNLLLSGNAPLTEIAIEAGFGSLSHFSRNFSAEYGFSPMEYRKANKQASQ